MANTQKVSWEIEGKEFEGHAVWEGDGPKPAVLVCHAWGGQSDFDRKKAEMLAGLGYVGFAMDVYGKGVVGTSVEENQKLMGPLTEDRDLLLARLSAGLAAARTLDAVDNDRIAAIGFCFGGLCVLDMARAALGVRGVVSFHGLFFPRPIAKTPIEAKVLALHGYDDPMAKPEALTGFCDEMTAAGADWHVQAYGNTMHAFTNPNANDPDFGTVYNAAADRKSHRAMEHFLADLFA